MVFNHKAYEELFPREEKQPKKKAPAKSPDMGNVLEEAEDQYDPEDDAPDEGGKDDGDE